MHKRNLVAVALWMAGALLAFSGTAVSVRGLSHALSAFETLEMRNAAGIVMLLAAAVFNRDLRRDINTRALPLHLMRNSVHFVGTYLWTLALTLLPLATAFALEFTAPLWLALLAVPLLGERLNGARIVATALGFVGVLVILRPGTGALQSSSFVMLGAALFFALTSIATKRLTGQVGTLAILLWMNVMQLPMNAAGALASGGTLAVWEKLGLAELPAAIGMMLCGLVSQLCLTNAFRHGDAMVVVPLDFLRIPLIALIGWWLYGEPLDIVVLGGAGLIIIGIVQNLRAEARAPRLIPEEA